MVKINKIVLIFIFLFCTQNFAQQVSALASVDSSNYLVGDYINYTLEVRTPEDIEITYPVIIDSLDQVEIIKEYEPEIIESDDLKSTRFHFIISYYDSSEVNISSIPVEYKTIGDTISQIVFSNPVTFNVHTVEVSADTDIEDVKSPITIPLDWKLVLLWILIGIVVLGTAYFLYLRYMKRKSEELVEKKIIKIPAHIKALTELDNLEKEQLWQKGLIKDYHSNITGIVRRYFEDRFELPALELTTSESMSELRKVIEAEVIYNTTNQFLNNADLVKFAKFIPLDSVNDEMMTQAKEIVNKTIPVEKEIVEQEEVNV
ncbi:MAG: hypothetical protein DRQ01_09435 [Ignavibacteriae bacterium]|nr:MAG: hypothetical protein DRQ01_09435 [Ignavibacteriota bacterium]